MFKNHSNQSDILNVKPVVNIRMKMIILGFMFICTNGIAQFTAPSPLPLPGQITSDPYNDAQNVGYCLNLAGSNSCTANDFTITSLQTLNVDDGCSSPSDYMQIDLSVTFAKQVPARYDVGAWFYRGPDATTLTDFNSQNAITGDFCNRVGVAPGLTLPLPSGGTSQNLDGDTCIDVPSGDVGDLSAQILTDLVLPCRDLAYVDSGGITIPANGVTDISACTSWKNLGKNDCLDDKYREFDLTWPNSPFANEVQPSTGSKCNCGEFDGGPLIVSVPDMTIEKVCDPSILLPGETTTCTITLTNNGLGALVGATANGTDGFFYQDDYPEDQGSIDVSSITPAQPNGSNTVEDAHILDSVGVDTSNQSLNIYPGTILGSGGSFTVTYDFITIGDATLPNTNPVNIIENTVCTAYYNTDDPAVFTYPETADNCSTDIVTTPVSISSFKANISALKSGYDFVWSTETETGNLGFNIYGIVGKTKYKLNKELIPSNVVDSMNPQQYSYHINSQFNGLVSEFILEDVDRLGRKSSNGFYKLGEQFGVVEDESAQKETDWYAINQEFDKAVQLRNNNLSGDLNKQLRLAKSGNQSSGAVDVEVLMNIAETGIYKVSYQDLSNLGVELIGLKSDTISVSFNGELIPLDMHVDNNNNFSQSSYFKFYAEKAESLYTNENVYTLKLNATQASPNMTSTSSPPHGQNFAHSFDKTVKINRNQSYSFSSPIASEPWYDTRLIAVHSPSTSYLNLLAKNKTSGDATLSLVYWGGLDFDDDDLDHSIGFKINGTELGSDSFDGLTLRSMSYSIDDDLLKESNEIELILPAQTVNKVDLINLESASLTYPSRFVASQDQLSFQHEEANFNVEMLINPDVDIFAIQDNDVIKLKNFKSKEQVNYTYNVQFSGISGEAKYIVIAKDKIATPLLRLSQAKDPSLAATKHLIIAHGNFIGHYLNHYAESTRDDYRIVDVADIYHLYSDNRPDGEAIKSYIADVAANGELQSVLLVGGDTYDYKNYKGLDSISFVPTIYRATDEIIKFSAVDALFGDVDNNNIPEVAVGRLPVRTVKELNNIIAKSDLYISQKGELSAVLAADDSESLDSYQFATISNQLVNQLTEDNWSVSTAYLDEKSIDQSRNDIKTAMNDGIRLAIYTGHSSSKRWSFEGLFKNTDVKSLTNIDNPFGVVQWGCWNTYFVDPKEDSLGHEFMLSGKKGAAFVLGASTLTDASQESYFATIFNNYLISSDESIGSAMIKAKQEFAANRSLTHKDILWGVTILGDPLLKVK
jgi:hypothetical protein